MNLLDYHNFYLIGIKGVAMTSLAQCLSDAKKTVAGSDVAEDFVTKKLLDTLDFIIHEGFTQDFPEGTDCVIYTAAHQGIDNPQVQKALTQNIKIYSQAEALGELFNTKKGIAVCGVGGKSTVSAMISWILEKTEHEPSFSVGVGNIPGLNKTGAWKKESAFFVAEADEYVVDPAAPQKKQPIVPRFSYLQPHVTVCTNLAYDHPDVYKDFDHTKQIYLEFFLQIQSHGSLVINCENDELMKLAAQIAKKRNDIQIVYYGENSDADFRLVHYESVEGETYGNFTYREQDYALKLKIPGKFNIENGLAAIAACRTLGVSIEQSIEALSEFNSTQRRFEFIGKIQDVKCYDDYAHHPNEVAAAIEALNEWFPNSRKVVAFQSHTFSRTKELFPDFIDAFEKAKEVVMIDIFSSAREKDDLTVSSTKLCKAIEKRHPDTHAKNVGSVEKLAEYFQQNLKAGDVFLTLGAGDIYEVYQKIEK